MNRCHPNDSSRFLSGLMSVAEVSSFEDHLETCAACREALERGAGGKGTWQSACELLKYDLHRSEGGVSAERPANDPDSLPDCTSSVVLSFLAPSDDPAMAGRVGPYEVSGIVGRGSAGIVLKGFDRSLNRTVAIKVLDPALADMGAARQRFAREARAMAGISHEHLVAVHEVNEHAGLPFFVMEYVPGGSLERRLRVDGPFDVVSIVRIGLQTAQALATAHRHGLVHRDIKPGNILLDRGTERVRVADFGLVRVANDVSCTRSGIVAGTPQYMSPEQVRGETCDGQSDLFSLGAVMYALCTGHPPFRADTIYGAMQRIVHDVPRSIREQNPHVPPWLEEFILRLLAKDPARRFASADEVAQILQEELAHLQSPGRVAAPSRAWFTTTRRHPVNRKRRIAITAGVLAGGLSLAITAWVWRDNVRRIFSQFSEAQSLASPENSPSRAKSEGHDITPSQPNVTAARGERGRSSSSPLWDADNTAELSSAANDLEAAWRSPSTTGIADPWSEHLNRLRGWMAELSEEMDSHSSAESPSTNP